MIVRSIRVEGWRCFASPVELTGFQDGLNILFGPNGSGKSTLLMALARALFDNHATSSQEIKNLRSWGRDLTPRVSVVFEHKGTRYRLQKQFIHSASSLLEREEAGQFQPWQQSRNADEWTREQLAGESVRGASRPDDWGWAQVLWAPQGQLKMNKLATRTQSALQDLLGVPVAGTGAEGLEQKIIDQFQRYYTPSGRLKTGANAPSIVHLQQQLETARGQQRTWQQRLRDFEEATQLINDLRQRSAQAQIQQQTLEQRLSETRAAAIRYRELLEQERLHQQEMNAAEERYERIAQQIGDIQRARSERQEAIQKVQLLEEQLPAVTRLVSELDRQVATSRQHVESARARRNEVNAAVQRARLAERFVHSERERSRVEQQVASWEEVQADCERLRRARGSCVAPNQKEMEQIRKQVRGRDAAKTRLEAASITVRIVAESHFMLETSGPQPHASELEPNHECILRGASHIQFRIPGVGQFQATGPAESVEELQAQVQKAEAALQDLTVGFGTSDLTTLEARVAEAAEWDRLLAQAETRSQTLLAGRKIEQIRGELQRLVQERQEILNQHAEWEQQNPDPLALQTLAAELEQQATTEMVQAERGLERAQEQAQAERQTQVRLQTEWDQLQIQLKTLEQRLRDLESDQLDHDLRRKQLTECALKREAAAGKLESVRQQKQTFGDDPTRTLQQLEGQLTSLREQANQAQQQLHTQSGRLAQLRDESPYSQLNKAAEEVQRLEEEVRREQLQLDAIRLLYETLTSEKEKFSRNVLEPIRLQANHLLQRITGSRFESLEFNDQFMPVSIAPRQAEQTVDLEMISGGEQEQVHFATRLALARVAFPDSRELLVLDDVFTYTDATRLTRIAQILAEAADRFQIVLLTCHPERYHGLPHTKFFDLQAHINPASP